MEQNQEIVLGWLGLSEGGEVNHPDDPGGHTNHGVTQVALDDWRKANGLGPQSVSHLTKDEADTIFIDNYFRPVWFDRLPSGLDYAMADYSVNSGASRPIKSLQKIVGAKADGVLGVNTMAKINARDPVDLVIALCEERFAFMQRLKNWKTFKNGWTSRVMGAEIGVQGKDIGVIDRGVRMAQNRSEIPAPKPSAGKAVASGGIGEMIGAILAAIFGNQKNQWGNA